MKNNKNIQTDLLIESALEVDESLHSKLNIEKLEHGVTRCSYEIKTLKQKQLYGKDKGEYVLFDCKDLRCFDNNLQKFLINSLKNELKYLFNKNNIRYKNVLVIGLGNRNMMADCLGDKTVERIFTTRHFKKQGVILDKKFSCVSSYSCNVFGKTGIESASIVKKLVEIVKPNLVICVDTFVSNSLKRLGKSLQISSCGLTPGLGVGNYRKDINEKFLGVPVFTIGVPLLISGVTLLNKPTVKQEKDLQDLVVMDKEIEKYVKYYAVIISGGINLAVHNNTSLNEINNLIY